MTKNLSRCRWAESDALLRTYHDQEWGVIDKDSRSLWETLMLEGFQAGLAWIIVLRKREAFREAFAHFDPAAVARFGRRDVDRLMKNEGIIRARAKIEATIGNARAYLAMAEAGEDFSAFAWTHVGGRPLVNTSGKVLASTELSKEISRALKQRGFKFVGPVTVHAWMQATGMVDDHAPDCFRRKKARRSPSAASGRPAPKDAKPPRARARRAPSG